MSKAIVYGDNINTDLIIAGKYTKTLVLDDLARHCMEDLDPEFSQKVSQGDVVVAGWNFGCGSSREQAPLALKVAGISAVIAKSFARIFYRNAINLGMPVLVCDTDLIREGDQINIDLGKGCLTVNNVQTIPFPAFSPIMQEILKCGGLVPYLKEHGSFEL